MKPLFDVFTRITEFVNSALPADKSVKYSVKKYGKTYELLEEFDAKHSKDPKLLAQPGRLEPYIRELQKSARKPR